MICRALLLLCLISATSCAVCGIGDTALRLGFEDGGICGATKVGPSVILAAEHCFAGSRLVKINHKPGWAVKIARDGKDHVLVRVTRTFGRWAEIGPAPKQGDRVHWVGMPAGMDHIYREGVMAGVDSGVMMFDAQAYGGDSGSGIFDDRGRLVAVLSGISRWESRNGIDIQFAVAYPMAFTADDWESVR